MISTLRSKIAGFYDRLTSGELMREIVLDNEAEIVELNSEDQLYERGVNALGVSIDSYAPYADLTIEIKKEKGQPYNRVTLRDEGDFHRSFFLDANDKGFEILASNVKANKLRKKYGDEIMGLTDDNKQVLAEQIILPNLRKELQEVLG